jgi:hypothetical protein
VIRALTKDQILEKIAASGGVFWNGTAGGPAIAARRQKVNPCCDAETSGNGSGGPPSAAAGERDEFPL